MTLSNNTNVVTHIGNGATTVFPYTFKIPGASATDQSNVEVTLFEIATGAEGDPLATNLWSITGVDTENGGEVTYPLVGSPLAATHKINIRRVVDLVQELELTTEGGYDPDLLEDQLDLIVMMVQQLQEESDRAVKTILGSEIDPNDLIDDLLAATSAAAASAAAAATAETNAETAEAAAEAAQAAAEAAASSVSFPAVPVALNYLRRNAGNTAYEVRTPAQVLSDISAVSYASQSLTAAQKSQAAANILQDERGINVVINGNFDIWQRATSQTSSGFGSDDRWTNDHNGSTKTHSRQAFTLGQTDVPGEPTYFSRTVVTTAAGASNYVLKRQSIEGVRTLANKAITVTFWAKADASKNMAVEILQNFGTGGAPSAVTTINAQLVALTTSWQKFSYTINLGSMVGKTIGSNLNDYLGLRFWFDAGSSFNSNAANLGQQSGTFDIARVSVREGDHTAEVDPTPLRPTGLEVELCERYFEKSFQLGTAPAQAAGNNGAEVAIAQSASAGSASIKIHYKVRKRGNTTVVTFNPSAANSDWWDTNGGASRAAATAEAVDTGFRCVVNAATSAGSQHFIHWTADAEL